MGICIQVIRICPWSLSVHCHSMASIVCCCAQQKLTRQASSSTFTTKTVFVIQRTETMQIKNTVFSKTRFQPVKLGFYNRGFQNRSTPSMVCHVRNLPYLPSYPDFCTAQFQGLFFKDYQADRSRWATLCQATRTQLPNFHCRGASRRRF